MQFCCYRPGCSTLAASGASGASDLRWDDGTMENHHFLIGEASISMGHFPWRTVSHNQRVYVLHICILYIYMCIIIDVISYFVIACYIPYVQHIYFHSRSKCTSFWKVQLTHTHVEGCWSKINRMFVWGYGTVRGHHFHKPNTWFRKPAYSSSILYKEIHIFCWSIEVWE